MAFDLISSVRRNPLTVLIPSGDVENVVGGSGRVLLGAVHRETSLVVLAVVGGRDPVRQFVGADVGLGKRRRRGNMRSLGHETVLGVRVVFHLVLDAVRAGVRVVPLGRLSLVLGAGVLQLSDLTGRDTVTGLVAKHSEYKNHTIIVYYSRFMTQHV